MNKLWLIIITGVILRLALMPLTIHPDFKAYNLAGYLIAQKGEVFTFYDYISKLPRTDPLVGLHGDGQFNYPPLAYLSHGLFNFLLGPVFPWDAFERLIYDYDNFRGSPGSSYLLYLLKLPYLLADLLGLAIILKLFDKQRDKLLAGAFWLFNPFTLYSAYLMAQFDIFIAIFILAAIYLSQRQKNSASSVMLGLAAGFKPFPLVLLPFLPGNKIKNVIIGLVTYAVLLAPYLSSTAFKHYALFAAQSDKPLYAKIMVSGSQYLPLFVVGVVFAAWLAWFRPKLFTTYEWLSIPLLLFFSLTHFHPQWLTWIAPILVLMAVKNKSLWLVIGVMIFCFIGIIFSFDKSLNIGLFSNLTPSRIWVDDSLASLVRGVFAGTSLIVVYLSLRKE
jgi:hypothetical protein